MKDEETLATYKLQSGHTIHMVKGAASNTARGGASSSGPTTGGADARPTVPTNIAAGTGNNPLAGLTGARYAGHVQLPNADMFGPDGGVSLCLSVVSLISLPQVQRPYRSANLIFLQ